ncbi:MAG: hypothetical protein CL912_31765 [Deltaproteobacteria bacterium]|nr:hypothetical protein [Deltaproteobacteria bacterium]
MNVSFFVAESSRTKRLVETRWNAGELGRGLKSQQRHGQEPAPRVAVLCSVNKSLSARLRSSPTYIVPATARTPRLAPPPDLQLCSLEPLFYPGTAGLAVGIGEFYLSAAVIINIDFACVRYSSIIVWTFH